MYENTSAADRKVVEALVTTLEKLGLDCTTTGSALDNNANEADLVLIDLFLGVRQSEDDIERAICLLKNLVHLSLRIESAKISIKTKQY